MPQPNAGALHTTLTHLSCRPRPHDDRGGGGGGSQRVGGVSASHYGGHGNPPLPVQPGQRGLLGREGGGHGEVEQGERDGLSVGRLLGPVGHAYPGVHRLVAPQVVVVLELLVADGADMGGPAWAGSRLHCRHRVTKAPVRDTVSRALTCRAE